MIGNLPEPWWSQKVRARWDMYRSSLALISITVWMTDFLPIEVCLWLCDEAGSLGGLISRTQPWGVA